MFLYCKKCGYDSGDRDTRTELIEKVKQDGGQIEKGTSTVYGKTVCPKCKGINTLNED